MAEIKVRQHALTRQIDRTYAPRFTLYERQLHVKVREAARARRVQNVAQQDAARSAHCL